MTDQPEEALIRALIKHRVAAVRVESDDTPPGYIRMFLTDGYRKLEVNVSANAADHEPFVEQWAETMAKALRRPRFEVKA
jgi:hypothetical protein